ncbi:excalibur calcium-binding domain-containing protein [Nocardia sp. NPDC052566]|uniref:excalibur calcium-binding domain-containing protein n=1 Tax=Nocardia sp. NPDC052566 TaxID=3364330 RepID=UPI0037C6D369
MKVSDIPRRTLPAVAAACLFSAGVVFAPVASAIHPDDTVTTERSGPRGNGDTYYPEDRPKKEGHTGFYNSCAEARADGKFRLHRGQPGYWSYLDSDGDGVACDAGDI